MCRFGVVLLVYGCMVGLGRAVAEDEPPTDYAEQTVTFGFHNRGSNHWAGPISAACAGLTGLQNPLNDRTAVAQQGPDVRVECDGTRIPWDFPSAVVFHVAVTELRDARGPITLTLYAENGSRINMNGKPVELTKAGDFYNAYDNNGVCVARVQAEAQTTTPSPIGNAGGHVVLAVKTKPYVDFTLSANPAADLSTVDVVVRVFPATATLTAINAFTIERERTRWQNAIGKTTSAIEQVNAGDLTRWRIPAAYWYGDPDIGELCHQFQAPYRVTLQAQYELNGQTFNGQAKRTLRVVLPQYPFWTRAAHLAARPRLIQNTVPAPRADGKWFSTLTIPVDIFGKSGVPVNVDQSQYQQLITVEEEFHVKQWLGQQPRAKGGCGDLYTRNSVEYFLEEKHPDYDGQTVVVADTKASLEFEILKRRTRAVTDASTESSRLFNLRGGYLEKKAKQEAAFAEAYTYMCTYQPVWGENPANPDAPWRE